MGSGLDSRWSPGVQVHLYEGLMSRHVRRGTGILFLCLALLFLEWNPNLI